VKELRIIQKARGLNDSGPLAWHLYRTVETISRQGPRAGYQNRSNERV